MTSSWSLLLAQDTGELVGLARDVEYRDEWGHFGDVYFLGNPQQEPVYDWIERHQSTYGTFEVLPLDKADRNLAADVRALIATTPALR